MADTFSTDQLNEAIDDVAADKSKEQNFQGRPADAEEANKKAREHGYTEPVNYNYEVKESTRRVAKFTRCDWIATGELGVYAPRIPALEAQLYPDEFTYGKGLRYDVLDAAEIQVIGEEPVTPIGKFEDMKLHPVMNETLKLMHYLEPTKIQQYVIPAVIGLRDLVVSAQTGSGKTVAYLCPIFSNLMGRAHQICAPKFNPTRHNPQVDFFRAEPLVLIILPTRELAWQVFDDCRRLCYRSGLRPCVAYGGGPAREQREELNKGCDILIATPGRLKDFLGNPRLLSLHRVRYTVIDEADELMHEDWIEDLDAVLAGANLNEDSDHVFMMFSATFPAAYRKVAKKFMSPDYLRIRAGRTGATHENIKQKIMWVDRNRKNEALYDVLFAHPPGRTIVFVNSKIAADRVDDFLFNSGLPSAALHSDRTQNEREDAMAGFRDGSIPILVTTGVAARGIDVAFVLHVINYDLPSPDHGGIDEYVHRIGRTGRLGHQGLATSFYNEKDDGLAPSLCQILKESKQEIPEFLAEFVGEDDAPLDEGDSDAEEDGAFGGDASTSAPAEAEAVAGW